MRHSVVPAPPRPPVTRLVLSGLYTLSAVVGLVCGGPAHRILAAVLLTAALAGLLSARAVRRPEPPRHVPASRRRHA
ncbi:hypothetical protein [Streptomyces sp. Tu 3180]|uniref:hypothetical protein n=1 Tax=Streptomyces sp. Tu 3180 TaxID=2682611 RepID=UPI00135C85DA|nr:hypothetical protein [Streptomyces sp. Tu 3180]KAF3469066.1 hypothetical protein GL259_35500 [Streptomyces sp. Tu 3180]